ncbi:heme biosynthesis protein HemY [Domibacillus epiphyticus]|uniref:Heme biosynthesis protein HemY n=1 Tax=Domibacillus epiphyticus TaxID=1714355 RepID=A0A1V2ABV8_9BACI|nr:heme biosynthesis protein HemY [Domibacillus epiphyticus]OMP68447.1 heme biosynthesis protein HemY [Domibacillus epiphyticus]
MKCKVNQKAANALKKMLESEGAEGKMIRVEVTELHGNHAHYGIKLDTQKEHDVVVKTDKGVDILLDSREEFLDGIFVQYFFVPKEEFVITNSSKGNHHHH